MQTKIIHIRLNIQDKWPHDEWLVTINGESFPYKTGLGHRINAPKKMTQYELDRSRPKAPSIDSVIESLLLDESCASESFEDFCLNLGYDTDSRKALDTYLACQANAKRLRKALGKDFESIKQRIESLNQ